MSTAGRKPRLRVLRGEEPRPGFARGRDALRSVLRVANRLPAMAAAAVAPHGLTLPQFEVLLCLRHGEGVSQQDLAERLLVTKGNVCVTVQRMEAAGLVDRRADVTDHRVQRLYLADAGRRRLAAAGPAHGDLLARAVAGLTPAEQATLYELLSRVEQALDDLGGD